MIRSIGHHATWAIAGDSSTLHAADRIYLQMAMVSAPVIFSAVHLATRAEAPTSPRPWVVVAIDGLFLSLYWPVGLIVAVSIHLHLLTQLWKRRQTAPHPRQTPTATATTTATSSS